MLRKKLPIILMAAALITISATSIAGLGTAANFTDTAAANASFTSGSADLDLASAIDCTGASYADTLALGSIAGAAQPGDAQVTALCLKNTGSFTYQWSLTSSISDDTSTATALESVTKIRVHQHSDNTTACVNRLDAAGASVALGVGESELMANTTMGSTNPSIAAGAGTSIAAGSVVKLCLSTVLPTTVNDSDPDAVTTIQGKVISAALTFRGN